MFCYQCEQTNRGAGCTDAGVCGKDATVAALQDLLTHNAKLVGHFAHQAALTGHHDAQIDRFVIDALFTTVTNVNFHPERMEEMARESVSVLQRAWQLSRQAGSLAPEAQPPLALQWESQKLDDLVIQGRLVSIPKRVSRYGADKVGLQEMLTYGLKGAAAYYHHAIVLGCESEKIYAGFHEGLDWLCREDATIDELFGACLACGALNYDVMALLDKAHITTFGSPAPTSVRTRPVAGKCIVVSGHDLADLKALLEQTEGTGINIYTHGEMLPAHGYPELKKHKHLVGNYGGPWMRQVEEFAKFPGAILMTTNCIQRPHDQYIDRIFTCGLVAWPGVRHIEGRDFSAVIEAALEAPGFAEDGPEAYTMVGFGHDAVLGVADKVVEAVKAGEIKHFFLIGGCDGAKPGRNYFGQMAHAAPDDTMILTLGCGKYRFNKDDFGTVAGLPRLLDIGQCNDAYSAIRIAVALAEAFGCGVNDLPLSLIISWYEQKACAVLLTLLYLGVKNIRLGPTLPAFLTPTLLGVLVEKFNITPTGTAEEDMKKILQPA